MKNTSTVQYPQFNWASGLTGEWKNSPSAARFTLNSWLGLFVHLVSTCASSSPGSFNCQTCAKSNRTSVGNLHGGCCLLTWCRILEELCRSRPARRFFVLSGGLVMRPAMQAGTSLRFSQLSLQCVSASQKPAVRGVWSPAENLNRLRKWKHTAAGRRAAKVPSSSRVSLAEKTKQRRKKNTPKRVFVYPGLALKLKVATALPRMTSTKQ